MTTRDEPWPEGTPAWVDLMVPDRQVARTFYQDVLGWEYTPESPAEVGYYSQALVDGRTVAGVGQLPGANNPSSWMTYLAVDAVDPVVQRATEAGATVVTPAGDIGDAGRMAVLLDPTGATFGLWQSGRHTGFQVANEPGTVTWNEMLSRDFDAAKRFYGTVFGYSFGDMSTAAFQYATLDLDGRPVGGIGTIAADAPAGLTSHWMTYFAVADADQVVARALDIGGRVLSQPTDTPFGRMAVIAGPSGEVMSLMGPAAEPSPGS
jgi:predicted enzyme related to lactoylglutathione lyase